MNVDLDVGVDVVVVVDEKNPRFITGGVQIRLPASFVHVDVYVYDDDYDYVYRGLQPQSDFQS